MKAIDVFCGSGGLSEGFRKGGFELKLGLDWNNHACATHEENFRDGKTWCLDVREVDGPDVVAAVGGRVDVVIGGPNCQGVSERGMRDPDDPRNTMFWEFVRLIDELQPRAFLMENVAGLTHRHNFPMLKRIFREFGKRGYRCSADVLRAADYGVPQLRHRLVMIGVRGVDGEILFPRPTHGDVLAGLPIPGILRPHVTLREAIGDLPPIKSGSGTEISSYGTEVQSDYQLAMRRGSNALYNHRSSDTAEINLQRISHVQEGGNWKDIPGHLLPPRFFQCRLTDHSTTYARLRWNHPAFTITALFGNVTAGAFTHPDQNRALSVREGARIQGYPDSFKFMGPLNSQYRQIGNSVPPILARAMAEHLRHFLETGRFPDNSVAPRLTDSFIAEATWDDVPVLTPRYKNLFGFGTRWPKGWGPEPKNRADVLTDNYRLKYPVATIAAE